MDFDFVFFLLLLDISIWLHQVVKGFQDSNGATLPNAHLLGLFHRLCKLMYYRIKPVFVFDGGVPPLKRETIVSIDKRIFGDSFVLIDGFVCKFIN